MKEVVIVSVARTAIGSFLGSLSNFSATDLGAFAIKGALDKIQLDPTLVDEVFMGNVISAGLGQAPTKQAAIKAGIPTSVPCTTINKVCASGMKSVMQAAQAIKCGDAEIIVAGGMESMSNIPHYFHNRKGTKFGNSTLLDGLLVDGLLDAYDHSHMGTCGDLCAAEYNFSRKDQDDYAINSYKKSATAWANNLYKNEIIPVEIPQRNGSSIFFTEDEEYKNVNFDKIPMLKPAFSKEGSVTAANASTLNDGAAAIVLMSLDKAIELNLKPIAKIKGYADASQEPKWFTTTPAKALPKAIEKAGLTLKDIAVFEINEAFSSVSLANIKLLNLDPETVNINGGAVSLGHPLGMSGTRLIIALTSILEQKNAKFGAAGICNGGGGASAIVIERM